MKFLKILLIILLSLGGIFIILALIGPSNYKITRSIEISAPIDVVFDQTSIYTNWAKWSPWAKMDSNAKYSIERDDQTVGSSMSWDGNPENVGTGELTTTKIEKNKEFNYDLAFLKPREMTSQGGFTYEEKGDNVLLTWFDGGEFSFMSRPMMLFMDLEEQIGPSFEKGLSDIKKVCEEMKEKASSLNITEETVESKSILFISESSSIMPNEIKTKMGAAYGELMALMSVTKLEMASPPITITHKFSLEEMTCEFDAALTVKELPEEMELSGRIQKGETYAGKVLKTLHIGSHASLMPTYQAIVAYISDNGYEMNGSSWEEYVDDPAIVAREELRTFIYFPIK